MKEPRPSQKQEEAKKAPETKTFSTEFIRDRVKILLTSHKNIQEVKSLEVNGNGNQITLTTTVIAKKGIARPTVGVQAVLENKGGAIIIKSYKIDANFIIKGTVEDLIVPKLNEVSKILKEHIEKQENREVGEIKIENGELKVTFAVTEATPI